MFKPKIKNIVGYFFLKYFLFYILMMFKNDNHALISIDELYTAQDIFYYLFLFLSLPVIMSIIFTVPLYFSFKVNNVTGFILLLMVIFGVEYLLYTYLASQLDMLNGLYNATIGLIVFITFYHKAIGRIDRY
jgi:hypothetical protein